ncbi:hypothetical protein J2X24_002967 [Asticcacaulis solisilvae]|nr:hypothetical protein [Asticcacaulis solisilvae]MDR6801305.1 hypothetical protein [Asticcacaulis sp. BE141]
MAERGARRHADAASAIPADSPFNDDIAATKACPVHGDQNPILIPVSGLTRLSARRASSAA